MNPVSHYFAQTGVVVSLVVILLALASLYSWTSIFQRSFAIQRAKREVRKFEKQFWKVDKLDDLYKQYGKEHNEGLAALFCTGYSEFLRLKKRPGMTDGEVIEGVQRVMRVASSYEEEGLEGNLPMLATIGSTSPYVGLFGTVWGIMMSFHA